MEHFLPNGELLSKTSYRNGLENGIAYYYNKGVLFGERGYKDGKLDGTEKQYYKNGKLQHIKNYKNDKLDGISEFYSEDGKLISKKVYKNGNLIEN